MGVSEQAVEIIGITGVEPVLKIELGSPQRRIVEFAKKMDAALIVMGSRGQTGLAAGSDVRVGRGRGDVQVNPCIATDSTLLGKSWGR